MEKKGLLTTIGVGFIALFVALSLVSTAQAAPKKIKISAVLPLTGKFSAVGIPIEQAYQIAVETVNASGGIYIKEFGKKLPVELKIIDEESDGQKTQMQLEAANSWGAVANLGGGGCASFELGTPVCQKNKMAWVGFGCSGWLPHQHGNKWLFSTAEKNPISHPIVIDMIMEQPEPRPSKIAIFEINQIDAQESKQAWQEAAKKNGLEVVFHRKYPMGTKDFSAMITGAKVAGADILFAYPVPPMGPTIIKQMRELDFNPKVIHFIRAAMPRSFGASLGKLADYVTVIISHSELFGFPGNKEYINKSKEKYNRIPEAVAGGSYAAAEVLFAAIERAGTLDRKAIRDAVSQTDMMTVAGPIKFSDQGWAEEKIVCVGQWMGGDIKIVHADKYGKKFPNEVPVTPLQWAPPWSER